MTDQQNSEERTRQQAQQRQREAQQQRQAPPSQPPPKAPEQITDVAQQLAAGKQSAFKAGKNTVTPGRAGERNLTVQWIDVNLSTYMSARFDIKTSPGNALEVQVQQDVYKRTYSGSGAVSTPALPGAPVGTKGKLTARDIVTGEMLEVPWTWYNMGSRGPGLWAIIKRLIWKSG